MIASDKTKDGGSLPAAPIPTEQADGGVVDDRLHDAIRQLRQHMTTIQAAKKASAAGQPQGMGPIWNLVNALPAIVRQLDAAELDIEAAFERYEEATPPATPIAGADRGKMAYIIGRAITSYEDDPSPDCTTAKQNAVSKATDAILELIAAARRDEEAGQ